jgi:hypothetical protein
MEILALNEPVIRALVARLEDRLPAMIDQINAEASDDYEIAPPAKVLPYIPSPGVLTEWPTVGIQHLPVRLEDDTGFSATSVSQLAIVTFLVDADLDALAWKLVRYERAVASAALENRHLDDGAWGTRLLSTQPGPTLGDSEDPERVKTYMSWTGVLIEAKADEG